MELWDGDPLNALDSTGIGFSAAPIPGTKVTFSDVPVNTRIVFRGALDPPVVTPHDRVWVVVTSDACRFVWFLAWTKPIVGDDAPGSKHLSRTSADLRSALGGRGWLDVLATDGARSASARTDPIEVAGAPPRVWIQRPKAGEVLRPDQPVSLCGLAVGAAGGALTDADRGGVDHSGS